MGRVYACLDLPGDKESLDIRSQESIASVAKNDRIVVL
jgi:hypothetical protein